jgi:hypothetical protein
LVTFGTNLSFTGIKGPQYWANLGIESNQQPTIVF